MEKFGFLMWLVTSIIIFTLIFRYCSCDDYNFTNVKEKKSIRDEILEMENILLNIDSNFSFAFGNTREPRETCYNTDYRSVTCKEIEVPLFFKHVDYVITPSKIIYLFCLGCNNKRVRCKTAVDYLPISRRKESSTCWERPIDWPIAVGCKIITN